MYATVPVLSIVFMTVSCVIGFALPVILLFYFRKKKQADILPFFIGCAVMLLFAFILETSSHRIILGSALGETIRGNTFFYALYGGFMAGIFEETGRFLAFKTVLRRSMDKNQNALMYGAGHGGFEAAVILGFSMINNIAISVMINNGSISSLMDSLPEGSLTQVESAVRALGTTSPYMFIAGSAERIFAVTLQIALSVMVWFAVKNRGRWYFYPAAIAIHTAADALTVIMSRLEVPVFALEGVIGIIALLTAMLARKIYTD